MIIAAIDPGLTNGYAWYNTETDEFRSGEYDADVLFRRLEKDIWAADFTGKFNLIVERFTINAGTAKKSAQPEALHVIGAIRFVACSGMVLLHYQGTANKKAGSNAKLKRLGWFKGGEGHADDAARHIISFLATRPEGQRIMERLAA